MYIIFDIETSGLVPYLDQILTGYFIKCDKDLGVIDELAITIVAQCSKKYWNLEAQAVHGITWAVAKDFDQKEYSFNKLDRFINEGDILVCFANYNNQKLGKYYFDIAFVKALFDEMKWHGYFYSKVKECMSVHTIIKDYSDTIKKKTLAGVCEHFKIEMSKHHDAKSDAIAAMEILLKLKEKNVQLSKYHETMLDLKKIIDLEVREVYV